MVAVADNLAVHGTQAVSSAYQAVVAVLERSHAVVYMGHGTGAVCVSHNSLLVGGCGMSDADYHAVLSQITGQGEILIGLGSHGDVFDMTLCSFLIMLKLLDGRFYDVLLRLSSLVNHIQVRSLKMDAENFSAFVTLVHDLRHIGYGVRQNLLALGNGSCQK